MKDWGYTDEIKERMLALGCVLRKTGEIEWPHWDQPNPEAPDGFKWDISKYPHSSCFWDLTPAKDTRSMAELVAALYAHTS